MLTMPLPLNPRRYYTREALEQYNQEVADYLAQQQQAEYAHTKNSKRNRRHDRNDY